MNTAEAWKTIHAFYEKSEPSPEDGFLFTEASEFLLRAEPDSPDRSAVLFNLGAYYYESRHFDLALKYYTLAEAAGDTYASVNLGYIWYYGRTGTVDYEKAFACFSRGQMYPTARYKLADMYRNGYYVEKDEAEYRRRIGELYAEMQEAPEPPALAPEIGLRQAQIWAAQGRTEDAVRLYCEAKAVLAQRLCGDRFFGNFNIMRTLIGELYALTEFDPADFDLYDLYYLLEKPASVQFTYRGKKHSVRALCEDGACPIQFEGAWYRTPDDFIRGAKLGDAYLTDIAPRLRAFEVTA